MGQLVRHDVGHRQELLLGGLGRLDEEQRLPVRDQPEVLHGPGTEVREGHEVDLLLRIRDPVVLGEEPERERARLDGEVHQVTLAGDVRHPQGNAVHVHRIGQLERTNHPRDEVRRRGDRVVEPDGRLPIGRGLPANLRRIRHCDEALLDDQRDREHGLQVGLVPAGEGPPGVGRLEVRRGDRPGSTVGVGVRRRVEPHEPLVQDPGELQVQRPLTRRRGLREQDARALARRVERDLRDVELGAVAVRQPAVLDLEVNGVQHDLADGLVNRDPDVLGPAKGPRGQVGLDRELVAGGGDGPG